MLSYYLIWQSSVWKESYKHFTHTSEVQHSSTAAPMICVLMCKLGVFKKQSTNITTPRVNGRMMAERNYPRNFILYYTYFKSMLRVAIPLFGNINWIPISNFYYFSSDNTLSYSCVSTCVLLHFNSLKKPRLHLYNFDLLFMLRSVHISSPFVSC
jgi:hypothetical protein